MIGASVLLFLCIGSAVGLVLLGIGTVRAEVIFMRSRLRTKNKIIADFRRGVHKDRASLREEALALAEDRDSLDETIKHYQEMTTFGIEAWRIKYEREVDMRKERDAALQSFVSAVGNGKLEAERRFYGDALCDSAAKLDASKFNSEDDQ